MDFLPPLWREGCVASWPSCIMVMKCVTGETCIYSSEWLKHGLDDEVIYALMCCLSHRWGKVLPGALSGSPFLDVAFILAVYLSFLFSYSDERIMWRTCYSRIFNLHYLPVIPMVGLPNLFIVWLHWSSMIISTYPVPYILWFPNWRVPSSLEAGEVYSVIPVLLPSQTYLDWIRWKAVEKQNLLMPWKTSVVRQRILYSLAHLGLGLTWLPTITLCVSGVFVLCGVCLFWVPVGQRPLSVPLGLVAI